MKGFSFCLYDGQPVGKGRPRVTKSGHAFTPAATRSAEAECKWNIEQYRRKLLPEWPSDRPLFEKPVGIRVKLTITFRVPASWSNKKKVAAMAGDIVPVVKPDIDNVVKLALDAMNGRVYQDDAQVCALDVIKQYGRRPGIEVMVTDDPRGMIAPLNRTEQSQILAHEIEQDQPELMVALIKCLKNGFEVRDGHIFVREASAEEKP